MEDLGCGQKLTMAGGWCLQEQRQQVGVELSVDIWGPRGPIFEPVTPPWSSLVAHSIKALQKLQGCHNAKAGNQEAATPLEVEGAWEAGRYQPHHREDLGLDLSGNCGPGSCTGPLHKERTRVQSLVSRYIESCADPAWSAIDQRNFSSSSLGPGDRGAGK